jgi:uncharacterized membrane-anchored protein YitT (DUF2179 family)
MFGKIKEVLMLTIATAFIASGVFFFMMPSHTAISSIAGLAVVLEHFIPFQVSTITLVINVALLLVGFMFCGKEFGAKTVYTTIILPIILAIYERVFPNYKSITGDSILDVICYIFLAGFGAALLFNMNASSGGLDIVAKIMNKYFHMNFGYALSVSGMLIALSSVFAYDKKTVVLSVLGTYFNGVILDHFIFDHNLKRRVCILPKDMEATKNFILNELHSGASIYENIGAFNGEKHQEIIAIVDKQEYQKLLDYLGKNEPDAFVTVYTVSDVRYKPKTFS